MKIPSSQPRPDSRGSLRAIPYEDTQPAKPPIPITLAILPPGSPRNDSSGRRRPQIFPDRNPSVDKARSKLHDDVRRDSGLAPSNRGNSTSRDSHTTLATDVESSASLKKSSSLPHVLLQDDTTLSSPKKSNKYGAQKQQPPQIQIEHSPEPEVPFLGIQTDIPTGSFEDLTSPGQMEFSKRGSMLLGGKKANIANGKTLGQVRVNGGRRKPSVSMLSPLPSATTRLLSVDDEILSQKVRSMYGCGTTREQSWANGTYSGVNEIEEEDVDVHYGSKLLPRQNGTPLEGNEAVPSGNHPDRSMTLDKGRESMLEREKNELAGGIEDWENLNGGDVDRYGFIVQRRLPSQGSLQNSSRTLSPEPQRIQRVSTSLQLASETPRRQRSTLQRIPSAQRSTKSATNPSPMRLFSRRTPRPASSQSSYKSPVSRNGSRVRSAANRLPHNRDRRWMDEAGDMLTLPPGLSDIAEIEEDSRAATEAKRKEWEREEKWRRMAKPIKRDNNGGGMTFEFDTANPKLIERTWKGIPDRWRATAWHAFLTASAKKHRGSPSDDELITVFHTLLDQSSPDDVQIDIDVPRTINSHIMFRRRYRGGQRLLFRVLHCLSIYFPDTGYVQGMAALAATLLCYFDEEMTFVMLVRLWQLRGLERLYQSGFDGLMQALDEFEKTWLADGQVSGKLVSYSTSSPPTTIKHTD